MISPYTKVFVFYDYKKERKEFIRHDENEDEYNIHNKAHELEVFDVKFILKTFNDIKSLSLPSSRSHQLQMQSKYIVINSPTDKLPKIAGHIGKLITIYLSLHTAANPSNYGHPDY